MPKPQSGVMFGIATDYASERGYSVFKQSKAELSASPDAGRSDFSFCDRLRSARRGYFYPAEHGI
jgi:hypothetical protein